MRTKEQQIEVRWEGGDFRLHVEIAYEPSQVLAPGGQEAVIACKVSPPYYLRFNEPEFVELKDWEFKAAADAGLHNAIAERVADLFQEDLKAYMEGR